jgi:hypothetical protein
MEVSPLCGTGSLLERGRGRLGDSPGSCPGPGCGSCLGLWTWSLSRVPHCTMEIAVSLTKKVEIPEIGGIGEGVGMGAGCRLALDR